MWMKVGRRNCFGKELRKGSIRDTRCCGKFFINFHVIKYSKVAIQEYAHVLLISSGAYVAPTPFSLKKKKKKSYLKLIVIKNEATGFYSLWKGGTWPKNEAQRVVGVQCIDRWREIQCNFSKPSTGLVGWLVGSLLPIISISSTIINIGCRMSRGWAARISIPDRRR